MKLAVDVPEEQHQQMRALQGREFVEQAEGRLYFCALQCRADKVPWPADLDEAHEILWRHLGRNPDIRRELIGPVGEVADE